MNEFNAKVINKGRITVPARLRTKLGIKDGDHVRVSLRKLVVGEVSA